MLRIFRFSRSSEKPGVARVALPMLKPGVAHLAHSTRLARVALSALLLVLSLPFLSACVESPPVEEAYVSPYDFSNLVREGGSGDENESKGDVGPGESSTGGRFVYYENGEVASRTGIDVSSHQGAIDWSAVAADSIEFTVIRLGNRGATEGGIHLDEQFSANIQGARNVGIPIGVYFFSQAINEAEAREEADFVLEQLAAEGLTAADLEYPVVFDHEPVDVEDARANELSQDTLTRNTRAFCTQVAGAGYSTMVYGNKSDMAMRDLDALADIPRWFAEYKAPWPSGEFDFTIWQYSNNGRVAGIDAAVDMNLEFRPQE